MANSAQSLFSYNITKPYPFKWFTPLTITLFCLLTVLISYLNYATIAFDLDVITSADFNATTANRSELRGLPDLLAGKYIPTCQPASLALNSRIFTNHSALKYEIIGIRHGARPGDGRALPALIYSNNVLEACEITSIQLEASSKDRTTMQTVASLFGIKVNTYVNCRVNNRNGYHIISIGNSYDYRLETRDGTGAGGNFVSSIANSPPSLWWGMSLLGTYYVRLARRLREQYVIPDDNNMDLPAGRISKAHFRFTPSVNVSDILDPHHLFLEWYMIFEKPDTSSGVHWAGNHSRQYASDLANSGTYPSKWWAPAEKLAKSAYSTVLTDLGNTRLSNLLLDGEKLRSFTSDFNITDRPRNPGPASQQFDPLAKRKTKLGTTPATIQATYICSKPRRKTTGAIVWLVILADIVFLQALWVIYKLIIDAWVFGNVKGADTCQGCQDRHLQSWLGQTPPLHEQIGSKQQARLVKSYSLPTPVVQSGGLAPD